MSPSVFACPICPDNYSADTADDHLTLGHEHHMFKCRICMRMRRRRPSNHFLALHEIQTHLEQMHSGSEQLLISDAMLLPADVRAMSCKFGSCKAVFLSQDLRALAYHLRVDHDHVLKDDDDDKEEDKLGLQCRLCPFSTPRLDEWRNHFEGGNTKCRDAGSLKSCMSWADVIKVQPKEDDFPASSEGGERRLVRRKHPSDSCSSRSRSRTPPPPPAKRTNAPPPSFDCGLCRAQNPTAFHLHKHLTGKRHQRTMEARPEWNTRQFHFFCGVCQSSGKHTAESFNAHLVSSSHLAPIAQLVAKELECLKDVEPETSSWWWCKECGLSIPSAEADSHCQSPEHRSRIVAKQNQVLSRKFPAVARKSANETKPCSFCDRSFKSQDLSSHLVSDHPLFLFSCKLCRGKDFTSFVFLKRHLGEEHRDCDPPIRIPVEFSYSNCPHCKRMFGNHKDALEHVESQHGQEEEEATAAAGISVKCRICSKTFPDLESYRSVDGADHTCFRSFHGQAYWKWSDFNQV